MGFLIQPFFNEPGQTQLGGAAPVGGVGQTTTGVPVVPGTGLDGPSITFGMASRRQTGPLDVGFPDGQDKHLLGWDADGHAINSLHLSTNTLWIGDGVNDKASNPGQVGTSYDCCPGGDAPMEFNCWKEPDEGIYPVPVRLGYDPNSQHEWCGGPRPGLYRWWAMCNYYVANSQAQSQRPGSRAGSPCGIQGGFGPAIAPRIAGQGSEPFVATVVQTASPVNLGRPNLMRPGFADLRSGLEPDRESLLAQDLYTPITYRMEAYGAQGGACSGSILGSNAGYTGKWIPGETWNYTELPGQGRFDGGTASGGVVLMPPEVDMADIDEGLDPARLQKKSTTFMIAAPGARFGAGLPNLADGAMDDGYSWFVDNGKLVFNRHVGDCPGLGVETFQFDTNGDMILGTGESGIVAATGKTFRAPDIVTGGAGNIPGAPTVIAAGIGTGIGDAAIIDFHLPIVAGSGDFIQTRASRLILDMDASTTALTMRSAQDLKIATQKESEGIVGFEIDIKAGTGGDASASLPAGDGGVLSLISGSGGIGSATQVAGIGSSTKIAGGDAGVDGGGGGAVGGLVRIDGGAGSGASADGSVRIGVLRASKVILGKASTDITINATRLRADNSTKIGIQVTNAALTIGTLGSVIVPVKTDAGAPSDAQGGNLDGALVVNSNEDALYFRSGGSWIKLV